MLSGAPWYCCAYPIGSCVVIHRFTAKQQTARGAADNLTLGSSLRHPPLRLPSTSVCIAALLPESSFDLRHHPHSIVATAARLASSRRRRLRRHIHRRVRRIRERHPARLRSAQRPWRRSRCARHPRNRSRVGRGIRHPTGAIPRGSPAPHTSAPHNAARHPWSLTRPEK